VMVRDPWGKYHRVNDRYDNSDLDISTDHVFNEMVPNDILTKNDFPMNRASTRVNESRDVTLIIKGPSDRKITGIKMGKKVPTNW